MDIGNLDISYILTAVAALIALVALIIIATRR
jgi:hypothetical protein